MLEEKLEKRRKMKMEKLQQKHENENKVVFTSYRTCLASWRTKKRLIVNVHISANQN
jgi:hypothetical protein